MSRVMGSAGLISKSNFADKLIESKRKVLVYFSSKKLKFKNLKVYAR